MLLLLGIKSFEFDWLRQPEFSSGRAPWPETISIRLYAHEISPPASAQNQLQHEISSAAAAAQRAAATATTQRITAQLNELSLFLHGRSKLSQFPLPIKPPSG